MVHDNMGHQWAERTYNILRQCRFWYGMYTQVGKYVDACHQCRVSKGGYHKPYAEMWHLTASRPLETLAIDFTTLEKAGIIEDVLVMTDILSKYTLAVPCRNQTAKVVAKALLEKWFFVLGILSRIHSDCGRSFENKVIMELCKLYGTEVYNFCLSRGRELPVWTFQSFYAWFVENMK